MSLEAKIHLLDLGVKLLCSEEESSLTREVRFSVNIINFFILYLLINVLNRLYVVIQKNGINLSGVLNKLFQEAYLKLCITVRTMTPCYILSLTEDVNVIEDGQIELLLTAMVSYGHCDTSPIEPSI